MKILIIKDVKNMPCQQSKEVWNIFINIIQNITKNITRDKVGDFMFKKKKKWLIDQEKLAPHNRASNK